MAKYQTSKKKYKSTQFEPSYQDLVTSTLKEKLPYFVIGIGVLFGLISGASFLLLRNTDAKPVLAKNTVPTIPLATATPTVQPTSQPTYPPTAVARPSEVVNTPKVDPTKAAAAASTKPNNGASKYVVKAGDTLWKIAEKAYKSGFNYIDVVAYNKIQNPNSLVVGQEILLPTVVPDLPTDPKVLAQGGVGGPKYQGEVGEGAMTAPVSDTSSTVTVSKGDTLWSIAVKTYGDGFSWKELADANNVSDPTKLEPGTVLKIPR